MPKPRKLPPPGKPYKGETRAEPLRTPVEKAVSPESLARLEALAKTLEAAAAYQRRHAM